MIIELHDTPKLSCHKLVELLAQRFKFSVLERYHPTYAMLSADR